MRLDNEVGNEEIIERASSYLDISPSRNILKAEKRLKRLENQELRHQILGGMGLKTRVSDHSAFTKPKTSKEIKKAKRKQSQHTRRINRK